MKELLSGAAQVCIYFIAAASSMFILRWLIKIPDELFRKMLHSVLLVAYIPFAFAFKTWWISVLFTLALEVLIYPALAAA